MSRSRRRSYARELHRGRGAFGRRPNRPCTRTSAPSSTSSPRCSSNATFSGPRSSVPGWSRRAMPGSARWRASRGSPTVPPRRSTWLCLSQRGRRDPGRDDPARLGREPGEAMAARIPDSPGPRRRVGTARTARVPDAPAHRRGQRPGARRGARSSGPCRRRRQTGRGASRRRGGRPNVRGSWDRPVQRSTRLLVGLVLYGLALAMLVKADLGLDPWNVLHQGVSRRTVSAWARSPCSARSFPQPDGLAGQTAFLPRSRMPGRPARRRSGA